MNCVRKIWKWLTKWKIVDTTKYELIKSNTTKFVLTDTQEEQVEKLFEEYGDMDYCFYSTGAGIGLKVKLWKTNEYIDLTC